MKCGAFLSLPHKGSRGIFFCPNPLHCVAMQWRGTGQRNSSWAVAWHAHEGSASYVSMGKQRRPRWLVVRHGMDQWKKLGFNFFPFTSIPLGRILWSFPNTWPDPANMLRPNCRIGPPCWERWWDQPSWILSPHLIFSYKHCRTGREELSWEKGYLWVLWIV